MLPPAPVGCPDDDAVIRRVGGRRASGACAECLTRSIAERPFSRGERIPVLTPTRLFVATVLTLVIPASGVAQTFPETNGAALRGVTTFDAQFITNAWLNVESDEERFAARGQTAFEREIRSAGVEVDTSAPNYLFCAISSTTTSTGPKVFNPSSGRPGAWSRSVRSSSRPRRRQATVLGRSRPYGARTTAHRRSASRRSSLDVLR